METVRVNKMREATIKKFLFRSSSTDSGFLKFCQAFQLIIFKIPKKEEILKNSLAFSEDDIVNKD